jgi:nitric oxide reductase subunit B
VIEPVFSDSILIAALALLIAGYQQSFIERAIEGSTWAAYFQAQQHPWFMQAMWWRQVFGWMTFAGTILLVWDLLTIGRRETRAAIESVDSVQLA